MKQNALALCWFLCAIMLIPSGLSRAQSVTAPGGDVSIEQVSRALELLTPQHRVATRPLIFAEQGSLPFAEIIGFDLVQPGSPVADTPPRIREGVPLGVILYWRALGPRPPNPAVTLRLRGAGPTQEHTFPIEDEAWPVGAVQKRGYELPMHRARYSGRGTFEAALTGNQSNEETVLCATPLFIETAAAPSDLDDGRLREVFGEGARRLNVRFRLGPGTSIRIPVRSGRQGGWRGLGVVSATSYDPKTRQGETVCAIEAHGKVAQPPRFFLQSGITTAKSDLDYYPPGRIKAKKIPAFASYPAGRVNSEGKPFEVHQYAGVVEFNERVRGSPDLTFSYARETGVLDVYELVLLPTLLGED